ncbi:MAG: hypothetical protein ABIK65_07830 [Candidatus Eisenbacteria bacterium]
MIRAPETEETGVRGDLFDGHRRGVALLRRLLISPARDDRDRFASYCLVYVRAYLQRNWHRWASGFDFEFATALLSAAHMAVAGLLREEEEPYRLVRLDAEMAKLWRRRPPVPGALLGDPPDWAASLPPVDDEYLLQQLRHLLRLESGQAMILEWKKTNPEKWRVWSQFKSHAARREDLRIVRDARGWFVCGPESDMSLRPMSREVVGDLLGAGCSTVRRALELLSAELSPLNAHGGYCVLSDLVLVYIDLVTKRLLFEGNGTGALPRDLGPRLTRTGLPESVWSEGVREDVRAMAEEYLERDARKNGASLESGCRLAVGAVVVEMISRNFDLGRPAWAGLSQKGLALFLVPALTGESYEKGIRERIDYTVRRIRNDLAMTGARRHGREGA